MKWDKILDDTTSEDGKTDEEHGLSCMNAFTGHGPIEDKQEKVDDSDERQCDRDFATEGNDIITNFLQHINMNSSSSDDL